MESTIVKRDGGSLIVSRLLDAPQELVFEVYTNPKHLVHWWGPDGFTLTNESMEVKPGGEWKFTMHGPDGMDFLNRIVFLEVSKPDKLVYKHAGDGDTENIKFHVTVTFEKKGNQTLLTMNSVFGTAEELDYVNDNFHAIEGGRQNANRLAAYLISIQ